MKLNDVKTKENEFSCIYMWENLVNGKKYVGQAQNFRRRMYAYQKGQFNLYMKSEIEEYGLENFEIHILEKDIPFEKLTEREQYWINYHCSYDEEKGYNRSAIAGKTTLPGERNGMYGKTQTKEWCKNHSEWLKEKWATDEDYRKFWSEKMSGENNYFYGVHMCGGENPHAKAIRCIETQKVYETIREAAKDVGISRQNIQNALKGRQKTAGGYHWEYV